MMMRIKEICDYVSRGCTPDYVDESPYKVMNQASFSKGYIDESKQRFTSKISQGANIRKGDLLMASTGGGVLGKVFYFDSDDESFYADSHVTIMRDSRGRNLMKYLYYAFSLKYDEINATLVKGSTNQTELQRNYLLAYELEMPSTIEQQRIVDYLDEKTKAIDARISVLEKKSDAYTRLKASVINRAVTRGLNPNVTLKDSDIEWIGMIPEHWEVKRIKDLCTLNRATLNESTPANYEFKYIDISSVTKGVITLSETMSFWEAPSRARRIVNKDDIIVSTVRTYLRAIAHIDWDAKDIIASTGFAVISPSKEINSRFLSFVFNYDHLVDEICRRSCGVSYPATTATNISTLSLPIPPLSEQQSIATYLDTKCSEIDKAIDNIGKQIEALKRLKRSLINEVVTGKRKML